MVATKKKASYFPFYWLFDRDPYNKGPYNWIVFHPVFVAPKRTVFLAPFFFNGTHGSHHPISTVSPWGFFQFLSSPDSNGSIGH